MATGLQQAHLARILRDPNLLEDMQENLFQNVRILVVGKSGCGKSTLIRLMMEEGAMTKMHQELPITSDRSSLSSSLTAPASSHDGRAGVQDVWKEWKHPDVPITFHDTNGMDTRGESRLHDIKDFLEMRQRGTKSTSFVERVHLVWYVVQSTPTIFMTYSLLVLGGILHVRCENGVLGGWSKHIDTPVETFSRQCVTFSTSTNYKDQLLPLVRKHQCLWDSVARTNSESEVIKNQIIDFYKHLVKTRPDSFFTLIRTTEEKMNSTESRP